MTRPDFTGRYPGARAAFRHIAATYPLMTAGLFGAWVLAGIFEGFGIASVLPLLTLTLGGSAATDSALSAAVLTALEALGLDPQLWTLLAVVVGLIWAKAACLFLASWLSAYATAAVTTDLRNQLLRAEFQVQWSLHLSRKPGEIASAIGVEPDQVAVLYTQATAMMASVVKGSTYVLLALFLTWRVTLSVLVAAALAAGGLHRFVRMAREAGKAGVNLRAAFMPRLLDALSGLKAIRAMGSERPVVELLEADIEEWKQLTFRQLLARSFLGLLQEPIRVLVLAAAVVVLLPRWGNHVEQLFLLALIFGRIHGEVSALQGQYQVIATQAPSYHYVREQIDRTASSPEVRTGTRPATLEEGVRFDGVSFSYGEQPVLRGVDLEIPARSFFTIVGASGAGKTTLLDLLLRLQEPTAGVIRVDGVPLPELDLDDWRRGIGYVPQETALLHTSVRANLVLGAEGVPEEDLWAALEVADAADLVRQMPEGLDTPLGERGSGISGGQRQRLAIARALCRRPRLLLLDEATASLDPETEARVCANLVELEPRPTILAISHQAGLVGVADRVLRVEAGRVSVEDEAGA